jgi:uncharacterized integral membrane protein
MLRKIVHWLILVPVAVILLVFAVANHHLVTVSLDPFDSADSVLAARLPLFVVILLASVVGVVCGGVATWFGQGRWRRAARKAQSEIRDLRNELQLHRGSVPSSRDHQPLALTRQP